MVDWYSRDTKIINFNWEVFYAEPGYEGKINGHCNGYWLPLWIYKSIKNDHPEE